MKFLCSAVLLAVILCSQVKVALAAEFKVLVVMSYEANNPWVIEIREGIDSVLAASSEITYFYMDTKVSPAAGPRKGEEAYALYQRLQPDGVIVADDDAQAMFVVPFLKDKVRTPVMFNGSTTRQRNTASRPLMSPEYWSGRMSANPWPLPSN